jgi:hypothetical protein
VLSTPIVSAYFPTPKLASRLENEKMGAKEFVILFDATQKEIENPD